jgi:hypothetical protein
MGGIADLDCIHGAFKSADAPAPASCLGNDRLIVGCKANINECILIHTEIGIKRSLHGFLVPIECGNNPNFKYTDKACMGVRGFSTFLILTLDRAILPLINE